MNWSIFFLISLFYSVKASLPISDVILRVKMAEIKASPVLSPIDLSWMQAHDCLRNFADAIVMARDNFQERVEYIEKVFDFELTHYDLLNTYVQGIVTATEIGCETIPQFIESNSVKRRINIACMEWTLVGMTYSTSRDTELTFGAHKSKYDRLFGFQILLECTFLGHTGALIKLQDGLNWSFSLIGYRPILGLEAPKIKTDLSHESFFGLFSEKEKTELGRKIGNAKTCRISGLVPDVPVHEEGFFGKFVRRIRGIPPPEPPPIPVLPTSRETDIFGYSHELTPIGLSAWLHLCRPCRPFCKPLSAYGVKAEGAVGFPLKRFVQPPYELPASVFAEEAAILADSSVGAAAAAFSSGAATPVRDAELPPASEPAATASASASCAYLPADDAEETDTLLGGTGSHVRHRAAAMAAASAVEEELGASSS